MASGEVHVYFVPIGPALPAPVRDACLAALAPMERARYERLQFERDRGPAMVGRGLLRLALSRYADVPPSAWRFEVARHGKPWLAGPTIAPPLTFNVTHTAGLAACAIALRRRVGVDAEPVARRRELLEVADDCLAPAERSELDRLAPEVRSDRMLEYWTLKEAYLKAVGVGLTWPLRGVAFELGPGGVHVQVAPELTEMAEREEAERWTFARTLPWSSHALAAAAEHLEGPRPAILFQDGACLRWDALACP